MHSLNALLTISLLAVLVLFVSSANADLDCEKTANRLVDTNDGLIARFDPEFVWEDYGAFCGISEGICEDYGDIYWRNIQDSPARIVRCSYANGSVVYRQAVTHLLLISCGDGRSHVEPWGKTAGGFGPGKVVCSTL